MDAHRTPLCAPSRYSILSGNYPHRGTRVNGVWSPRDKTQFRDGQMSIGNVFQDNGYNTAMIGKWHLGAILPPGGIKKQPDNILSNADLDWSLPLGGGPQDIGFNSSLMTAEGIQSPP